jgi:hypothetical protein
MFHRIDPHRVRPDANMRKPAWLLGQSLEAPLSGDISSKHIALSRTMVVGRLRSHENTDRIRRAQGLALVLIPVLTAFRPKNRSGHYSREPSCAARRNHTPAGSAIHSGCSRRIGPADGRYATSQPAYLERFCHAATTFLKVRARDLWSLKL